MDFGENISLPDILSPDFIKNLNYPNDVWDIEPTSTVCLKALVLGVIFVFAAVGNSIILCLVARTPPLHSPVNLFIANVALSDLILSSFGIITFLLVDIHQNYILGPVLCKVDGSIKITCLLNTAFSLIVVSCDRLLGIVYPFKIRLNNVGAFIGIFLSWILAIVLAAPPYFYRAYQVREWRDRTEKFCYEDKDVMGLYWIILLIFMSWIPFAVMTIAYSLLICRLDKYDEIIRINNPRQIEYRRKVIKMLFAIIVVFYLSWLPFQAIIIYRHTQQLNEEVMKWYKVLSFFAHFFIFLQTAVNPIIYGACSPHFRRIFFSYYPCLRLRNRVTPRAVIRPRETSRALTLSSIGTPKDKFNFSRMKSSCRADVHITRF